MATYRNATVKDAELLTGDILPKTDGTGAASVLRFEDIVALTSLTRCVAFWARPCADVKADFVTNYEDPYDNRVVDADVLEQVCDLCKKNFGIESGPRGYHGVIPIDWTSAYAMPLVTTGYAMNLFFADEGMQLARVSDPDDLGHVTRLDDLRKPYYDLKRMRRFFLQTYTFDDGTKWADAVAKIPKLYDEYGILGPLVAGDGDTTYWETDSETKTTRTGYRTPFIQRVYDTKGAVQYMVSMAADEYVLGIPPYRYCDELESGDVHLAKTLTAYVCFLGNYAIRDGSSVTTKTFTMMTPMSIEFKEIVGASSSLYGAVQALYTINLTRDALALYLMMAENWLAQNVTEWNSKKYSSSVILSSIHVDTGEVQNYFTDLSSWTWEPNAN